jgi:heat shock protein HtpX
MYIVDFFKNLFKKSNTGVIIWLVANVVLLVAMFSNGFTSWEGVLLAVALYARSMVIALSPIGEWILRLQTGCKKITDAAVLNRIKPLFDEVYAKAKAQNPELSDKIGLFMNQDDAPNAFATGRKTVCITRGLLNYSDEDIKGVLGHEFGHLAHKDTDIILVVAVGNMIMSAIFVLIRVIANVSMWIGQFFAAIFNDSWAGFFANIFIGLGRIVADFLLVLFMRVWTQIGVWLCMASSRKNEFEADRYSYELGYGNGLYRVLESFGTEGGKTTGLFASLASSHPKTEKRLEKLRRLASEEQALLN